jgi:hypothetical protein
MKTTAAAFAAVMLFACVAWGQEHPTSPEGPAPAAGETHTSAHAEGGHANDPAAHPALPDASDRWPGTVVIVILSMFLAAAVVGPIVRANMPEEVPPAHSHDEPPGASHHHGKSGTLNPEPGHGDHGHADHGHH